MVPRKLILYNLLDSFMSWIIYEHIQSVLEERPSSKQLVFILLTVSPLASSLISLLSFDVKMNVNIYSKIPKHSKKKNSRDYR